MPTAARRAPSRRSASSASIPHACSPRPRTAQGGPFEKLSTGRDGSLDPRFERLGAQPGADGRARARPHRHSAGHARRHRMITSGFGYRSDPFNGGAAMHAGLDFRGPIGAPIHAAAKGRVTFVGTKPGYGNVVEISHGNGLMTRYAHMSALPRPRRPEGRRRRRDRRDRQHRPLDRPAPAFRSSHPRPRGQSAPLPGGSSPCSRRSPSRARPAPAPDPRPSPWLTAARPSRCSAPMSPSRATSRPRPTCMSTAGRRRHRLRLAGAGRIEPRRRRDHRRHRAAFRHGQGHRSPCASW